MKFVAEGKDLSHVRLIDFSHLFPDIASANRFAAEAKAEGFKIAVDQSHSQKKHLGRHRLEDNAPISRCDHGI
jgi:hypothetical protein